VNIDIYQYSSALSFLQDFYKNEKDKNQLTLRDWAESMGLESPAPLIDILKNKRPLKLKHLSFLNKGLKLNADENLFFETLLLSDRAEQEEKDYFHKLLTKMRPVTNGISDNDEVFSHWLNVAILGLSKIKNFSLDVKSIQEALTNHVDEKIIEASLSLLIAKKYFFITPQGEIKRASPDFIRNTDDVSVESTLKYYSQVINRSQDAIALPVKDREFQCFSFSMKKENLTRAKEILRSSRTELASLWDEEGDHVYQFNLTAFPVAQV
jgi:uncharacterized protein (TIGR02147 family)